jgi:hypothetical protein
MTTRAEAANVKRFTERYRLCCAPPMIEVEGQALGSDEGLLRRSLFTARVP